MMKHSGIAGFVLGMMMAPGMAFGQELGLSDTSSVTATSSTAERVAEAPLDVVPEVLTSTQATSIQAPSPEASPAPLVPHTSSMPDMPTPSTSPATEIRHVTSAVKSDIPSWTQKSRKSKDQGAKFAAGLGISNFTGASQTLSFVSDKLSVGELEGLVNGDLWVGSSNGSSIIPKFKVELEARQDRSIHTGELDLGPLVFKPVGRLTLKRNQSLRENLEATGGIGWEHGVQGRSENWENRFKLRFGVDAGALASTTQVHPLVKASGEIGVVLCGNLDEEGSNYLCGDVSTLFSIGLLQVASSVNAGLEISHKIEDNGVFSGVSARLEFNEAVQCGSVTQGDQHCGLDLGGRIQGAVAF